MSITIPLLRSVHSMLREGLRHCEIARLTGLSVWSVTRIANDARFLPPLDDSDLPHCYPTQCYPSSPPGAGDDQPAALAGELLAAAPATDDEDPLLQRLFEDDAPPDYLAANLRRCPTCGDMVYQWPCLTCQLRAHNQ